MNRQELDKKHRHVLVDSSVDTLQHENPIVSDLPVGYHVHIPSSMPSTSPCSISATSFGSMSSPEQNRKIDRQSDRQTSQIEVIADT